MRIPFPFLRIHATALVGTAEYRNYLNPAAQRSVQAYIERAFASLGMETHRQVFLVEREPYTNIIAILDHSNIPCRSLSAPWALAGVDFSDHRNYWIFGFDAVMVTDTAFLRNKNYHHRSDTLETLDFGKMAKAVLGLAGAF